MRMILFARRLALFVAAAVPFVLLPVGAAWSVGPLARVGARWCSFLATDFSGRADPGQVPAPSEENAGVASAEPPTDERTPLGKEAHAPSAPVVRARNERPDLRISRSMVQNRATTVERARPHVFVGPDSIQRAIPMTGRPTSSWTNRTSEHPAGLLIQSPGVLRGVIEAGDILVEAEGQALSSFEQLIVTVRQAYERRVTRLSGRLFRKGDLLPVTVEPGW
jgi:hypothetical protein